MKLEGVGSIQEQASLYLAKWMNNTVDDDFKYENTMFYEKIEWIC